MDKDARTIRNTAMTIVMLRAEKNSDSTCVQPARRCPFVEVVTEETQIDAVEGGLVDQISMHVAECHYLSKARCSYHPYGNQALVVKSSSSPAPKPQPVSTISHHIQKIPNSTAMQM